MISTNQFSLTWEHFEDVNPNKRESFENLCRSLFYRTKIADGQILHSDPNHPGVEVAPVLSKDKGEMVSFQAKYFDDGIGYDQIKSSINKAVAHYTGKLDTIFLYCNKDITTSCQSYKTIETIAANAGMKIIPVTGQSILDEAMNFPQILACYFGLDCIGREWFEHNLQISLDNLGRRFNSLFNIDTEAKRKMSLFLKNDEGAEILNNRKLEIIEDLKDLRFRSDKELKDIINQIIKTITELQIVTGESIDKAILWKDDFDNYTKDIFAHLCEIEQGCQGELDLAKDDKQKYQELRSKLYVIERIRSASDKLELSENERSLIENKCVFVTGEMGTGKSQLLATTAQNELSKGRMSLLLLGQTFISDDSLEKQILKALSDIDDGVSFEALLAQMDEKAFIRQEKSIIFIDAINESRNRNIWKEGLNRLLAVIDKYKNILVVISLRTGFEQLMYSEKIASNVKNGQISSIVHRGFNDESPKAIFDFLSYYGVPISPDYYLQNEMTNPLFLMWFCQTYSEEERGLIQLINEVIKKADKEASSDAGYAEPLEMLDDLLEECLDNFDNGSATRKTILGLKTWETYGVTNKIAYVNSIERAGVLASYMFDGEERYYVGYNLLEDYFRADWIIKEHNDLEKLKAYCREKLLGIDKDGRVTNFGNESVLAMVASLYAIKFGEECTAIFDDITDEYAKRRIVEEYLGTFAWRNSRMSLSQFVKYVSEQRVDTKAVWNIFIQCATKEKSVFNAEGLSELLSRYKLNKRDSLWTTCINDLNEEDRIVSLAYYYEAGNEMVGLQEKSIERLLTLYAWMLSSSNRVLRDRISKAMVEILKNNFKLCSVILDRFKDVNDPYIIQRLYGIVFGAIMKRAEPDEEAFEQLAVMVYKEVFAKETVYPDILLRDYARLIVERFIYEFPKKGSLFDIEAIRPPYSSESIPTVKVVDYSDKKYQEDGLWRLLYSMKFNANVKGVGFYGDFGRYVFQSALNDFIDVDEQNIYYYSLEYILNDLGYSNELFGSYDSRKADFDRHDVKRIERIGKKYEWIAMYNILARLSDTHKVDSGDWNDKEGICYEGPWNPYVRDFDPTLNVHYKIDRNNYPQFPEKDVSGIRFIDKDSTDEEINQWVLADDEMYSSFPERFIRRDSAGKEWVSMYLYQEVKRLVPGTEEFSLSLPRGEQHIWAISSLHIAEASQKLTVSKLEESGYVRKNSGMNTTRDCYSLYSREYAWSPGYKSEFDDNSYLDDECTIKASSSIINAMWEEQCDASQDQTTSYYIPAGQIIRELGLYQKQYDGTFYYDGEIAAFDTSVLGEIHGELLIRKELLEEFVNRKKVTLFWDVVGEKQFFLGSEGQIWQRREGYFIYGSKQITGEVKIVPNM